MKKTILLLMILATLIGCKKDKYATYTGTLYKNCSKEPAAFRIIGLYQTCDELLGAILGKENITSVTTNENGEFEITFKDYNGFNIEMRAGSTILRRIPPQDLDLGNIYINNRANLDIYLDVKNSYTSSDTLIISSSSREVIIGPFNSGLVQSIEDKPWTSYYDDSNLSQSEKRAISWGINPNSTGSLSYYYYQPTGCEARDEIIITIE